MRVRLVLSVFFVVFAWLTLAFFLSPGTTGRVVSAQENPPAIEPGGGGPFEFLPIDEITTEQRAEMQATIRQNITKLESEKRLEPASPEVVALSWPVRKANGLPDFNVEAISNYVDHNFAVPNQLSDWNCGTRTYDQANGYNHQGIDIFTWPFGWRKMDNNEAEIVAAAPGTIVFRGDGNFDRSCALNSGTWNAIAVRHSDGSVAWYGHMKLGSLTAKQVGNTVVTGERLGIVGSSGNSTGPHLHFELYNASNQVQDPFQGPCNTSNNFSWWANQEPYRNSRINRLMTQSAPPVFGTCPAQETPNEKTTFKPGEIIFTAGYFRDQLQLQQTQYEMLRPDGSIFQTWTHNSSGTFNASFWWWSWTLPTNAPKGTWKLKATFNSQTYETPFYVSGRPPFDFDGDSKTDVSVYRPDAGEWFYNRSSNGTVGGFQFGKSTDKIVPADYDGDEKTDVAYYRASKGTWNVLNSATNTVSATRFGNAADIPLPGDFDGDRKADINIFQPSNGTWRRLNSSDKSRVEIQFGASGDKPQAGDFDGDGKADIAVFKPSSGTWSYIKSSDGSIVTFSFGLFNDLPVPADYDGDGKTDAAVYRPSQGGWLILKSSDGGVIDQTLGLPTDIPAPGDYDGDGKADAAVFRPSDGDWLINRTTAGTLTFHFGVSGDTPVPNAFVR